MKKEQDTHGKLKLRDRAEAFLNKTPSAVKNVPPQDVKNLVEELQIHQVELEMQNEELRRAQLELQESRDRFSDLYDFAPVGYFTINHKGLIQEANLTGATMLGVERGKLINWPFSRFITTDTQDIFYLHRKTLFETKTGQNCELMLKKGDGTEFHARLESVVIEDDEGNISFFRAVVSDIQERHRAEEALRENEERFRTVADFTHDWEYWIAPEGHYIYVSPSCERITGYTSDAFINDPGLLEKIVHPDDRSIVANHIGEEQGLEKLSSFEFRIIARSGEERCISHVCQTVYGADGSYLGRRGSNRDISKQKLMQEELLKAKKLESVGVLAGGIAHDFNNPCLSG